MNKLKEIQLNNQVSVMIISKAFTAPSEKDCVIQNKRGRIGKVLEELAGRL